MTMTEIRAAVLALSRAERASLARELIDSLDSGADPDAATEWATEITRRAREVSDGTANLVDWESARARIAARLRALREVPPAR